jgi:uncharacterized protein
MDITFDPAKDSANQTKHGLSLAFGEVVIADAVGVVEDDRNAYGEIRPKAYTLIGGSWIVCTYTMRGGVYHIISVHRVREKEAQKWLSR